MHLIGFRLFAHPDEERSHQEDQCEGWKVKQLGNIPLAVVLLHLGAGKHARQRPCAWVSVTVQHLPSRCFDKRATLKPKNVFSLIDAYRCTTPQRPPY